MAWSKRTQAGKWKGCYRDGGHKEHSKTFDKKRDADRWANEQERAVRHGEWIEPTLSKTTFAAWSEEWKRSLVHLRPATLDRDLRSLRNHVLPRFGTFPLSAIVHSDVQSWVSDLQASGMAASTVHTTVRVMSKAMKSAVKTGRISKSPCEGVRLPQIPAREMAFLRPDEITGLVQATPAFYRPLILTAAYAGLRWGELAGLKVERLNPLRASVHVIEQVTEVSGQLSWGPPKTAAGQRSVILPASLAKLLGEHVTTEAVVRSGLVFPSPNGAVLRRTNFRRRVWLPAVTAARLPAVLRFHDLRHTAVALAIAEGAHPKAIQERMGHASVSITLDRYGHMFPSLHEHLAEALDAVLRDSLGLAVRPLSGLPESSGLHLVTDDPSDQGLTGGARKNRTSDLILIRDAL